jgi:hypothetical protein
VPDKTNISGFNWHRPLSSFSASWTFLTGKKFSGIFFPKFCQDTELKVFPIHRTKQFTSSRRLLTERIYLQISLATKTIAIFAISFFF